MYPIHIKDIFLYIVGIPDSSVWMTHLCRYRNHTNYPLLEHINNNHDLQNCYINCIFTNRGLSVM